MSIWDALLALITLPLTVWLLRLAGRWYWWSDSVKACCSPAGHRRRMAEWQRHIVDAQQQLDYYLSTPNWFELEWPICDDLQASDDGEYCVRCFRQAWEHSGS